MAGAFHKHLNSMALFTALVAFGIFRIRADFLRFAITNIYMNGAIIGITIFGAAVCFLQIFSILPEYQWLRRYFTNKTRGMNDLPPAILRPIAIVLNRSRADGVGVMSAQTLNNFLNIIMNRFEDQRDAVRYLTNILILIGLLGTFWGLLNTTGGFAEMLNNLSFEGDDVMETVRSGLAGPMKSIGTAFSTSFFGLSGSLIVGFLGLLTGFAQNAMFRELEEGLAARTVIKDYKD